MSPRRLQQADVRRIADMIVRRGGDHYSVAAQFAQVKGLSAMDRLRLQRAAAQRAAVQKVLEKNR
jgi:hypothetical protein